MKTYATKPTCISRLLTALALIALWLSVAHAPAMPSPASHEMSGIVQRIDAKTVTILPAGESKSMVFSWSLRERNLSAAENSARPIRYALALTCRFVTPFRSSVRPSLIVWHDQVQNTPANIAPKSKSTCPVI
ncbi:MAG TPA: hypothetical protein VLQ29_01485 [Candidatus Dormibacteraeota bacterium]|nr:hypothetical protein [Candidatus Dormibacteraeota bacterium]